MAVGCHLADVFPARPFLALVHAEHGARLLGMLRLPQAVLQLPALANR